MIQFDYSNIFQMGWNHQLAMEIKAVFFLFRGEKLLPGSSWTPRWAQPHFVQAFFWGVFWRWGAAQLHLPRFLVPGKDTFVYYLYMIIEYVTYVYVIHIIHNSGLFFMKSSLVLFLQKFQTLKTIPVGRFPVNLQTWRGGLSWHENFLLKNWHVFFWMILHSGKLT